MTTQGPEEVHSRRSTDSLLAEILRVQTEEISALRKEVTALAKAVDTLANSVKYDNSQVLAQLNQAQASVNLHQKILFGDAETLGATGLVSVVQEARTEFRNYKTFFSWVQSIIVSGLTLALGSWFIIEKVAKAIGNPPH